VVKLNFVVFLALRTVGGPWPISRREACRPTETNPPLYYTRILTKSRHELQSTAS